MSTTSHEAETPVPADPVPAGPAPAGAPAASARTAAGVALAAALAVAAAAVAVALPDATTAQGQGAGAMTHYMELLSTNQPWNLLLFMAVPVVLAETLAITELALLALPAAPRWVRAASRGAGLAAGVWFTGVFVHLMVNAVVPLTAQGAWRGPVDVLAVGSYLAGIAPLAGIALLELGVVGPADPRARAHVHAALVGTFLVVAHVAMIAGMLDPSLIGYTPDAGTGTMGGMTGTTGMGGMHGSHG